MATKTSTALYEGPGLRFSVQTGSGHTIVLDDGHGNTGPRPVEMLLAGQAGCTGMDVMSILQKKRQDVTRYEVSVEAKQRDGQPAIFTTAQVVHLALAEGQVNKRRHVEAVTDVVGAATIFTRLTVEQQGSL